MKKRSGLSTMGYAIVLVIILAVGMIFSAPMLVNKYENDNKELQKQEDDISIQENSSPENDNNRYMEEHLMNVTDEVRNIERHLSSRIDGLEMQLNDMRSAPRNNYDNPPEQGISDKYICEIVGVQNEYGNTVPLTPETDITSQRLVFVCEYRR